MELHKNKFIQFSVFLIFGIFIFNFRYILSLIKINKLIVLILYINLKQMKIQTVKLYKL